jgi:hypothetical protein
LAEQRFWGVHQPATGRAGSADSAEAANGTNGTSGANGTNGSSSSGGTNGSQGASNGAAPPDRRIRPTSDPGVLVRSLGPPPLALDPAVVERHLTAVYEEAVRAATALAAASGLLADDDEERA